METDRIAITGVGLVTSLGLCVASSLAAIRSGIANFSEHETVMVNGNESGTELSGARIARLPEQVVSRQMHGAERAVALLAPAIRECTDRVPKDLLAKAGWRLGTGVGHDNVKCFDLLQASMSDLPSFTKNQSVDTTPGRCHFFENVIQAAADLRNATAPIVIVGCVDSLCDEPLLEKMAEADRLKSGSHPEGLVAGEAAGVFLLELESHAIRRNASVLAYLGAWGRGLEPHPWSANAPSIARGLRSAFEECLSELPGKGEEIGIVIADLNGERARANEWAIAAARIFPTVDKVRELRHPADCTGDCGDAMGAVLIATAIDGMLGGSAPANVAISTSDDAGARRVICLQRADRSGIARTFRDRSGRVPAIIPAVIDQHLDDASFLWLSRQRLSKSPSADAEELNRIDERIEANLEGLYSAGEAGWELATRSLAHEDSGDFFTASFLALKSGDRDRIGYLLDMADNDVTLLDVIASALGWLPS